MLNLIFVVHQDGILHELSLQETFLVDWAVEKALVAEVPEKVHSVVLREEILAEVPREVRHLVLEQIHRLVSCMVVDGCPQFPMKQGEEAIVLLQDLVENLRVLFAEIAVLELCIGDSLAILRALLSIFHAVEAIRMLDDDVEPDVSLDLAEDVGVRTCRNALNRRFHLGKGLEKVDDTLADADLLPLLVNVHIAGVEEVDLAVGEFLLAGLVGTRGQQSRIHDEDGANLDL